MPGDLKVSLYAAAGREDRPKPIPKQLSLSESLEKAALVPLRNTLKLKSQRLRSWDLDIHYSSKEELVRAASPVTSRKNCIHTCNLPKPAMPSSTLDKDSWSML